MSLQRSVDTLTDELVTLWAPQFEPKAWPERLQLLNDVHDQLQEDIGDLAVYSAVSPVFIRKLIDHLNDGPIASAAQAHVYANSDAEHHRRAAGIWLNRHKRGFPKGAP